MAGERVEIGPYMALLAEQLRQAGVEEERVRVIAADVRSHVIATREDPVQVFGQPADYAREWATPPSWRRVLGGIAARSAGVVGLLSVVKGAMASSFAWGAAVPVTSGDLVFVLVWIGVWGVVPWTVDVWLGRRAARAAGQAPWTPDWAIRVAAVLIVTVVVMVAFTIAGITDADLGTGLAVPRWLLVVGGLALSPLFFRTRAPTNRTVPMDPHYRPAPLRRQLRDASGRLRGAMKRLRHAKGA